MPATAGQIGFPLHPPAAPGLASYYGHGDARSRGWLGDVAERGQLTRHRSVSVSRGTLRGCLLQEQRESAAEALLRHAATTDQPLGDEPMSDGGLESLRRLNDCASCHQPDLPSIRLAADERSIDGATDSLGFIVPNAVLQNSCVVAEHRPEDLNREDPFVTVRCPNGHTARLRDDGEERYGCADGSQPRGHRDVAAGLAAGHPYAEAVCASRRGLHARMTPRARSAFREAFASCGIR
jgi:hypothetical protein